MKETTGQPLIETLKVYLRGKRLLLLLDNFEQVVEASVLLVDLLVFLPGLKMLVTSRAPLHLQGEHLYQVPPSSVFHLQQTERHYPNGCRTPCR